MSGANAGNLVALFKIDSSGAQASMTAAEITTAKALESMKRQFIAVSARVKELEGGARSLNTNLNMAKATQEVVNFGATAQKTQKEIMRANQMLPAQISDITVSLASGQQAWLVAIQQGSQIKDMYGGWSGALQALTAMISLKSVALTAGAAVVGYYAYSLSQAHEREQAFANGVRLTGNAVGLTAQSMESMAARVAAATTSSVGSSREIIQALSNTGRIGPQEIEKVSVAVQRLSSLSGQEAEKLVASFASAKDGVTKWTLEQNKQLNFMTPTLYAAAKAAEEMGNKSEALNIVLDAMNPRLEKNASLWEKIKANMWLAMPFGLGTAPGSEAARDPLAEVQASMAKLRGANPRGFVAGEYERQMTTLLEQERYLKMARDKKETDAAIAGETARANAAGMAAQQAIDGVLEETKSRQRLNQEIERYKRLFAEAKAAGYEYSPQDQQAVFDALRKKYTPAAEKMPKDALHNEYAVYARDRMESDDAAWAARQKEDEQRKRDQWEIEKRNAVQIFRDESEAREKEIAAAKKHQAELAKHGQDQVKTLEDSVMHLVRNGKDGFKDLFNTMAEEFIRNMIRMAAQKTMLDSQGGFVGWGQSFSNAWSSVSGWFGGGGSFMSGNASADVGFAGGLDYVPYDGFPAILHKGERVQRSIEAGTARSGGGSDRPLHIDNSITVQGDAAARTLRLMRAGQNMQAARMANAERY